MGWKSPNRALRRADTRRNQPLGRGKKKSQATRDPLLMKGFPTAHMAHTGIWVDYGEFLDERRERASHFASGWKFHGRSSWMPDCGWPLAIFSSVLRIQA